jgi:choline dehydrogenase-like flavoprotein
MIQNKKSDEEADYVIVGSGAAGATAGLELARNGADCVILEEGSWHKKEDFTEDIYGAMAKLFRDFGMEVARGKGVVLLLDGRAVGGSTVMNGAIVHRLPEEVWSHWAKDEGIRSAISFEELEKHSDSIEQELLVRRTIEDALPTFPISKTLKRMGWSHQAMMRNAPGCRGSDRCLQGCPTGGKWSMDVSFLPKMAQYGGRILPQHRVTKILVEGNRATGVLCESGKRVFARHAVLLAAGTVHSPRLLRSIPDLKNKEIGRHFQCHLSVGINGLLPQPAANVIGPPQGIEIMQFHKEGVKLATQPIPPELMLSRSNVVGRRLSEMLRLQPYFSGWMSSIRSTSEGTVSNSILGGASIKYSPSEKDLERIRFSLTKLAELLFECGAERVFPGIQGPEGTPVELKSPDEVKRLLTLPLDSRYYLLSAGHLFGTCRMGSDPKTSVVGPDFRVHGMKQLYVIDASVFPTNTGFNPQHSIMAMSRLASQKMLENK